VADARRLGSRRAAAVRSLTRPATGGRHRLFRFETRRRRSIGLALSFALSLAIPPSALAQVGADPPGEWRFFGGDSYATRYSPLDQIDAGNFERLEVAWNWRGDNFGPEVDYVMRSMPLYAGGRLFTVAGSRRTVVAIDPATGETVWTFREPPTTRWERSMRRSHGKGVAYAEIDGRGVIYMVSPAFFLHALDAETGLPLEGFGRPVPLPGFGPTGTVDLLADLGHPYDPDYGIPRDRGMITSSSPPIVVNGVVIVGNSGEQGYEQTRRENVPGDILAYDARTGEHLWTFNVIPRPGQFGHDSWLSDAWSYTGNVSSWAPMAADRERGIVYIPTDGPTNDFFGGFYPGDNLFSNTVLALDVRTGQRVWHYQTVRHDIWNYDLGMHPVLMDVTVEGRRIPILAQVTKQGFVFTFDRVTGEPVWPIEDRSVPASEVPGEFAAATQPFPTRPLPFSRQGFTDDDIVDFTPEVRARAVEVLSGWRVGPLFSPPLHRGNALGLRGSIHCPRDGSNIYGGAAADPETGILYVTTNERCMPVTLVPGNEVDAPDDPRTVGRTVMEWVSGSGGGSTVDGIPLWKPPYTRIVAIDMNTGEHLWSIVNGDTPASIRNHPRLRGVEFPPTGNMNHAVPLVTRTLFLYGEGIGGAPFLHAVDKRTGAALGSVELPAPAQYSAMSYLHEGRQYIVVAVASAEHPGSLVALRLP
jgi:glucose dehydrogenase